ncbi:MAG: transposase [Paludibacteraceae bacterium]|nr:transposase [Paludibacteraceae bacterium]
MKRERRKFTAEFKAQVAIEAIKGQETLSQLSERFKVLSVMISKWKSEFIENASAAFDEKKSEDAKEKELEQCYSKIGKLEMKLDLTLIQPWRHSA